MTITNANIIVGLGDGTVKIGAYGAAEGASTDVGATEGGVELSVEREYFEKTCDQTIGVLEIFKTAEKAMLKFAMAEATLDNLRLAIDYPAGALVDSTLSYGGDADVNELTIYVNVVAPSGGTRKYTFHKCVITSAGTHSYKKDDKTMIEVEAIVLQDTSKTADQQLGTCVDTGSDTTAPTIAMTAPADGGTVTKETSGTVVLTITDASPMNENTIVYGDTINIINTTVPASAALEAGTIVYNATAKTITFTPTSAWTASDEFQVIVTTGLKDVAGNALASTFVGQFSVTA